MTKPSEHITYKIAYISRMHKRKIDQDTLKYGLTNEQGRMILYLHENEENPIHLKDLEKAFHLRKSSLNSVINNLEKNGFVTRSSCESDSRLKTITLTDLGREKVKLLNESFAMNEKLTKEVLTEEEITNLNIILDKIISKINKDGGK